MKKKIRFLLWTLPPSDASGGIIVMYKLAELLAIRGYETYTSSPPKPGSLAIYAGDYLASNFDMENTMVIYPEIVIGNPFNAIHVTRWILYTPGKIGGDGVYGEHDLIYKYWEFFEIDSKFKIDGYLRCLDTKKEFFVNLNKKRNGVCYLVKKGSLLKKELIYHPEESFCIDKYNNDEHLLNIFNENEIFISYDSASYHSIQAALCGCISVVIPDENISKEEWMSKQQIFKYGVAYGLDDVQWARDTMKFVKSELQKIEDECEDLVDKYISKCKKTIKPKFRLSLICKDFFNFK